MPGILILQLVLTGAGILAVWGGIKLPAPALAYGGIILCGAGLAATGAYTLFTGKLYEYRRNSGYHLYQGAVAWLHGTAMALAGGLVVLVGALLLVGLGPAARDLALRRPSLALLPIGLSLVIYGLGFILGPSEWRGLSGWELALTLPTRLGGLILFGLGLAALSLGLFEYFYPAALDAWVASVIGFSLPHE